MRIIKTEVYKFEELSDEVQEEVLDKHRMYNVEYDEWWDSVIEYWKEMLDVIGFEDAEIFFSGFWSQGDGAVFEAEIDLDKVCSHLMYCDATTYSEARDLRAAALADQAGLIEEVFIHRRDTRYSHENTATVSWCADYGFIDCVMELIEDFRLSLCQEIYISLEKEYEYLTSDEVVKECIIETDMEFTKLGEDWV